jgi:hypothetical protein
MSTDQFDYDEDYEDDCEVCGQPFAECECPSAPLTPEQAKHAKEMAEYAAAEASERDERRKAANKHFGRACRLMSDLLAVRGLPHAFEDAKPWVRMFEDACDSVDRIGEPQPFDVSDLAAEWLDAGWSDPDVVKWVRLHCHVAEEANTKIVALGLDLDAVRQGKAGAWGDLDESALDAEATTTKRGRT